MQRLFFAIFILIGFVLVLVSGHLIHRAYQSLAWPSVPAIVEQDQCRTSSRRGMFHFVEYQYTVQGRQYESTRLAFGGQASTSSCQAHFKPGDSIIAYYDPAKPAEAVLERGSFSGPAAWGFVGLFFMVMPWFMARIAKSGQAQRDAARDEETDGTVRNGGRGGGGGSQYWTERPPLLLRWFASLLALGILLTPVVFLVFALIEAFKLLVSGHMILALVFLGFSAFLALVIIGVMRKGFGRAAED